MHEAVETAIEVFQSAWGMLSPDFEPNVDWNTLEQNPHLVWGVEVLRSPSKAAPPLFSA